MNPYRNLKNRYYYYILQLKKLREEVGMVDDLKFLFVKITRDTVTYSRGSLAKEILMLTLFLTEAWFLHRAAAEGHDDSPFSIQPPFLQSMRSLSSLFNLLTL